MKVIIAGSRSITDYHTVLDAYLYDAPLGVEKIISGDANGVDSLAKKVADKMGVEYEEYEAEWDNTDHPEAVVREGQHGKYNAAAGPLRNRKMAEDGDVLIAVWDGQSDGTRDMVEKALEEGIETHVRQT